MNEFRAFAWGWFDRHASGVWAFAVAVAYVPMLPSNAVVGRWAAVAIGAAILLWRARVTPSFATVLFGCLLAWIALGLAWSVSRWDTGGELCQWVVLAAAFCVAHELESLDDVWTGFIAGVSVSAAFALAQHFGAPVARHLGDAGVWSIYQNPVGLFLSKNMAADAAVLALIGCFTFRRLWMLPGPALALILVGGRAAVLALGAAIAASAWLTFPRHRLPLVTAAALGLAALTLAAWGGLLGRFDDRVSLWALVVTHLHVFGDGLGSFAVAAPSIEFAHNEFLQYAFELGIGSAFLWGIFAVALSSGPVLERAAVTALLAQCVVWFPLHAPAPAFMGMVLAGHLCGLRDRAVCLERSRGMARSLGLLDVEPTGIGAMQVADHHRLRAHGCGGTDVRAARRGRRFIPAGQERPVGA